MRIQRFNERNLTIRDLNDTAKDKGAIRGNILVDKLRKQSTDKEDKDGHLVFLTKPPQKTAVDNPEEIIDAITDTGQTYDVEKATKFFLKNGRYNHVFKVGEKDLKLNQIDKTEDFGKTKGSSLGTRETKIVESLQCLFCSLRQFLGEDLNRNNIFEIYDDLGEIRDEVLDYAKIDVELNTEIIDSVVESWGDTFISTANSLFRNETIYTVENESMTLLDPAKKYYFMHIAFNGGIVLTIYNQYRKFDEVKGIPISKWNPADMWVISSESKRLGGMSQEVQQTKDINSLNNLLDGFFYSRDLIGISLKKINESKGIKLLINKITPRPIYYFLKVQTSISPLKSQGVNIILYQHSALRSEIRDVVLCVRTFSKEIGNVSGEILGDSARHGKIGLNQINNFLASDKVTMTPTVEQLAKMKLTFLENEVLRLNPIIKHYGDAVTFLRHDSGDPEAQREDKIEKINKKRIYSKYQSLHLADTLYKEFYKEFKSSTAVEIRGEQIQLSRNDAKVFPEQTKVDKLLTKIMYYALAIENHMFICPLYVRIL